MHVNQWGICVLFFAACLLLESGGIYGIQESIDRESLERFLLNADIVSIDRGRGRRTESWEIELSENGVRRRGFFKLTDVPRPDPRGGDSYRYVLAAYELDKILDLNLVPPTVERKIKGNIGSLMLFLDPPVISEKDRAMKKLDPPDNEKFKREMAAVNVFEHLIYFPCLCNQSDPDNILIQTENGWKVWMVDLSTAFPPAPRLIPNCPLISCPEGLFEKLVDLDEDAVRNRLGPYLTEEELDTLIVRRGLIVEKIEELKTMRG